MPAPIRRIVLVCKMTYGDFVLVLPFLSELKRRHPQARVTMICGNRGHQLCQLYPWIDEVVNLDVIRSQLGFPAVLGRLVSLFRADVIYALHPFYFAAAVAFLLAGRRRVGFAQASVRLFETGRGFHSKLSTRPFQEWLIRHVLLHRAVTMETEEVHAADRFLQLLDPAPEPPPTLRGLLSGVYPRKPRTPLLVVLAPFSGWTPRNWPLERWVELAVRLRATLPEGALIVSVDPASAASARRAFAALPAVEIFQPGHDFDLLFRTFASAALIVSNDSFPLHVGSALDVPTIGLFGPNLPKWFGGRAVPHEDLFAAIECNPCVQGQGSEPCQRGLAVCAALEALSVEAVASRCLALLGPGQPAASPPA
ncbi:MAG: glycosyltransferase family 9 protein [Chthoniobacteraceae bacterium]